MPIVPSSAERVRALIRQLASERPAERDSAVARLTLLGSRAVDPLLAALPGASVPTRLAALELLERLDDGRTATAVGDLVADPSPRVALRAVEVLGHATHPQAAVVLARLLAEGTPRRREAAARALARQHEAGAVEALDPLVDALVDEDAPTPLRLAVLDSILQMEPPLPRKTLRPLSRRLARSEDSEVAGRAADLDAPRRGKARDVVDRLWAEGATEAEARVVARSLETAGRPPLDRLHQALERAESPGPVQRLAIVLESVGTPASIPVLSRALARTARAAETADGGEGRDAARAAVHAALASLDSRVALHDLRELVVERPPTVLPQVLDAVARIGDASLVPPLARAATEDPRLAEPCAAAYRAIARRERLRKNSAALRKVRPEHRGALEAFTASSSSRRR